MPTFDLILEVLILLLTISLGDLFHSPVHRPQRAESNGLL